MITPWRATQQPPFAIFRQTASGKVAWVRGADLRITRFRNFSDANRVANEMNGIMEARKHRENELPPSPLNDGYLKK